MDPLVIVGGGHAAAQLCASLVEGGWKEAIVLVTEERYRPYHRPPLSKTLIQDAEATLPELKGAEFFDKAGIDVRLGQRVTGIDRGRRELALVDSEGRASTLAYSRLVLATGARARRLSGLGEEIGGVHVLRNFDEAQALREALKAASHVTVVGGGFIGLEVAASARGLGKDVTVIEAGPRLLARSVSPQVSGHLLDHHRAMGSEVLLGVLPEIVVEAGRVAAVVVDGRRIATDLLLVGIGAEPNIELAAAAGLECANGIVVDALLATSDPAIAAIGDCTSFPAGADGARLRLESVQNANDQARSLAARLLGEPRAYAPVPWFWSDQGGARLQIVGLWSPDLEAVIRPGARETAFSVLHYDGAGQLRAVESINSAVDHMTARKWLAAGHSPDRAKVVDSSVPIKAL